MATFFWDWQVVIHVDFLTDARTVNASYYSQGNGPIRNIETCHEFFFFFTARVHTTKSTVKILAAKTHCKYFLKIAEFTPFFLYAEPLVREVCTILPSV
jgi:hypothetical protein